MMSEKALRLTFLYGSGVLVLALLAGSWESLSEIKTARTAPVGADVVAGKRLWERRICQDCHTLLGIGGYWAPELTKIAAQRDSTWLIAWLRNPRAVKPGTTMPDQHLGDPQARQIAAFLGWVSRIDTNRWPPAPRGAAGPSGGAVPQGALLFQQKGCVACHMIGGRGARGPGPDLSRIGSSPYDRLSNAPDFLYRWLENPKAIKPGTVMPAIPMTPEERLALVQYLTSLK